MIIDLAELNNLSKKLGTGLEFSLDDDGDKTFTHFYVGDKGWFGFRRHQEPYLEVTAVFLRRVFAGTGTELFKTLCTYVKERDGEMVRVNGVIKDSLLAKRVDGSTVMIGEDDRYMVYQRIGAKLEAQGCVKETEVSRPAHTVIYRIK